MQKRTLSEVVRTYIQSGIIEGRFHPGQRLREVEIANELSLSRSPIREAIKVLQNEGLVHSEPWSGIVIAKLSRTETLELFVYREILDGIASEMVAKTITDEEVERLHDIVLASQLEENRSSAKLVANNQEFHQLIYSLTRNEYIVQSVGQLRTFLALLPGTNYEKPGRREVIVQEHLDIVDALRRRDPPMAKEAARTHVKNSAYALMSFILAYELQ